VLGGILVAVAGDFTRWAVIVIAIPTVCLYLFAGRIAVVLVITAFVIRTFAFIAAGLFALVALLLFITDRPPPAGTPSSPP
jgi:hypothetical protein